jgi:hypothetical protein
MINIASNKKKQITLGNSLGHSDFGYFKGITGAISDGIKR